MLNTNLSTIRCNFNSSKVRLERFLDQSTALDLFDFNSSKVRLEPLFRYCISTIFLYFNSSKVRLEPLWAQMWIVFVYHLVAVAKIRQESGKKCRCRKIDFGRGYDNCISEGYNVIKELKF